MKGAQVLSPSRRGLFCNRHGSVTMDQLNGATYRRFARRVVEMIKRFDIMVSGHYPSKADREYCEDGDFVDADVANDMYEALLNLVPIRSEDAYRRIKAKALCHYELCMIDECSHCSAQIKAIRALLRARGEL